MRVQLRDIRPNNWYLSRAKLDRIRDAWRVGAEQHLPPVLVSEIDGQLALIDGHCRAYAAWEQGEREIEAVFEPIGDVEGSTALYAHIHRAGPAMGVSTLDDLADRIVSPEDHERLWIGYCERWLATHPDEDTDPDDETRE